MANVRRRADGRAPSLRRAHQGPRVGVRRGRHGRARRAPLQLRRARPSRSRPRVRSEREAADVQRVLRGTHAGARSRGSPRHARRRSVRRPRLRPRLRHDRARSMRRPLVARRSDAPALVRGGGARVQPLRVAVPARHRRDAARDRRDARERQRSDGRVRQPRRRQRRPRLRRRRLRLAERTHRHGSAALPGRVRGGDRRSRPHAPPADREHDVANRPGGLRRGSSFAGLPRSRGRPDVWARASPVPGAEARQLLSPYARPRAPGAGHILRGHPRRPHARRRRLLREDTRVQDDRRSGVGGRDSLLCLVVARRYLERKFAHMEEDERARAVSGVLRAFFMPTRFTSAETRLAAECAAAELGAPLVVSPSTTRSQASSRRSRRCSSPARP